MNINILSKLGFTDGEIKVYLALLKLGNVTSGPIVDESGVSKSKVYEILERLTKKGIVSQVIENNIKYFQAVNPKRLIELYEEKEKELKDFKKDLMTIMPELELQYSSIKEKQEITVFRNFSGLKSIFQDIANTLKESADYLVFVAVEPPDSLKPFLNEFREKLIKKKIKQKIIFNKDVKESFINENRKNFQVKTIFPEFNTPAVFNLYSNKTAILLWSKNPMGIIIENKEITDSFRKYFEMLWKLAKK